jgi:hypothetical protein
MNLKDIKTLSEISKEQGIKPKTLYKRFESMINSGELKEFSDYRKLGGNLPVILSKGGVEKIIGGK